MPIGHARFVIAGIAVGTLAGCVTPFDHEPTSGELLRRTVDDAIARELEQMPPEARVTTTRRPDSPVERQLAKRSDELRVIGPQIAEMPTIGDIGPDLSGDVQATATIDLNTAIVSAVSNNLGIRGVALSPAINYEDIIIADSVFDFEFFSNVDLSRTDQPVPVTVINGIPLGTPVRNTENYRFDTGLRKTFRTGGTAEVTAASDRTRNRTPGVSLSPDPAYLGSLTMTFTQPLLEGFGEQVNTATVQLTRNAYRRAGQDLRDSLLNVVRDSEAAYWDLVFAWNRLTIAEWLLGKGVYVRGIFEARQEIDAMPAQYADAVSRVEQRNAGVISARRELRRASDRLKVLINNPSFTVGSEVLLLPSDLLSDEPIAYDLAESVRIAIAHRPEIERAILDIDDADIRKLVAENATLPRLDLFTRLSYWGLDDDFGSAAQNVLDDSFVDYALGLSFAYPPSNREAEASLRKARLLRTAAVIGYRQAVQNIVLDVKNSLRDVVTNYELIGANRSFRTAAAENLRVLEVQQTITGYTPEFLNLMFQRQDQMAESVRDLVFSRVNYRTSIADLHRAMGVALEKNQIEISIVEDAMSDGQNP